MNKNNFEEIAKINIDGCLSYIRTISKKQDNEDKDRGYCYTGLERIVSKSRIDAIEDYKNKEYKRQMDEFEEIKLIYHSEQEAAKDKLKELQNYRFKYLEMIKSRPYFTGCSNWLVFGSELAKIEYIQFLLSKLEKPENPNKNPLKNKIRWMGNQTELITIFFDMQTLGLIECHKTDIERLIINGFSTADGEDFKKGFVTKVLKPDEPKAKNQADFSDLL